MQDKKLLKAYVASKTCNLDDAPFDVQDDIIRELDVEIAERAKVFEKGLPIIEALVAESDDAVVRVAIRLHYVRGLQWKEAASIVKMRTTSLQNRVYDFVFRLQKQEAGDGH